MMTLKTLKSFSSVSALFVPLLLCVFAFNGVAFGQAVTTKSATVEDIRAFFKEQAEDSAYVCGIFRCRLRG